MTGNNDDENDLEQTIFEGRLAGVFNGFRAHGTLFKFQGGVRSGVRTSISSVTSICPRPRRA